MKDNLEKGTVIQCSVEELDTLTEALETEGYGFRVNRIAYPDTLDYYSVTIDSVPEESEPGEAEPEESAADNFRRRVLEAAQDYCGIMLSEFVNQCLDMAKENWCKSQADMLYRVAMAVSHGLPYDSEELDEVIRKGELEK